ncbi:MAG: hypothetical protein AMJ42_00675 [Deltaproteobacteria bacterium DG_8]|nr:MAG: hypothetical protein AMJ42_00675 [Deltaproteobacteria bacterium DG_8]
MADEREKDREEKEVKAEEGAREKEQQGEKGAAEGAKKRSKTELDIEGLDVEEVPQEDAGKDEAADKQEEKIQKEGISKRDFILTIFTVLLLLVMISGGVFIWARYFASKEGEGLALSVPQGPVYELKPFFVPLNSDVKSKKFMRLTLVLELSDETSYKQITKCIEEVRSNIFKIIVNASPKNIENTQGKEVLAEKIISIINLLLAENIVKKVFFKDVLVI